MFSIVFSTLLFISYFSFQCEGHGMVIDPIARSSRWRQNDSAPMNFDDAGLFCGGFQVQHEVNGGKCGLCGDDFRLATPRPNELGGLYGEGVVVKRYSQEDTIDVKVMITANHLGHFYFDLCNVDQAKEEESCFEPVFVVNGERNWYLPSPEEKVYSVTLQLPENVKCTHCVFRWTYVAGNNWGVCDESGNGALGCGIQEHFRTCSDITILDKTTA